MNSYVGVQDPMTGPKHNNRLVTNRRMTEPFFLKQLDQERRSIVEDVELAVCTRVEVYEEVAVYV